MTNVALVLKDLDVAGSVLLTPRGERMANYQLKLKERRVGERKRPTGLMPGRFQIDGKDASARPVDISNHGLGILVAREYRVGTKAALFLRDHIIEFEIKWGQPDFGKQDLWRYGLVCLDENIDVLAVFEETGCFR